MLRLVVACLFLWWGLASAAGPRHERPWKEGRQYLPHKMKRSAPLDSPTTSVTEEFLQTLFINQLDSRAALADVEVTTQETKKLLEDMYQTFTTHLSEHRITIQGADRKENLTQHLLQEVEELQQKVLQQGTDLRQVRAQLLQKEETLQQQETTLQQQRDILQQQEATLQEKEDILQRTKEEYELLKREVRLGEGEKRLLEEEFRQLEEEHRQMKEEAEAESRTAAARYVGCASQLQQQTQDNQVLTDLNTQLRSNNTVLQRQARLAQQLQEENRRLRDEKDGLEEKLEECQENTREQRAPADCEDHQADGLTQPGVYHIFPNSSPTGVNVYCEFEEGLAWTVFLARRRQAPQENFNRPWQDYKNGFGNPLGEYWLGNDNLHALTGGPVPSRLRVEATNLRGEQRSAEWVIFRVGDEASRYQLSVGGYVTSSTLGDALVSKYDLNGMSFSTVDRDHDKSPFGACVPRYGGGGWWYRWCSSVSPTAPVGNSDGDVSVMSWAYFNPEDEEEVGLVELKMMHRSHS